MGQGSNGGGGKGGQTVQKQTPWNRGDLRDAGNMAGYLMAKDIGYKPFQGPNYSPFSQQSLDAFSGIESMAKAGNPSIGSANSFIGDMTSNNGMSSDLTGAMSPLGEIASGQRSINAGNYQGILGGLGGPTSSESNLGDMASGKFLSEGNPYLMRSLQQGASDIALRSATGAAGSGRYGSGAAGMGTAKALGNYYDTALSNAWNQDSNRMLQANQTIDAARNANTQNQLAAAAGIAGVEGTNISNQANAANLNAGFYSQGLNRALSSAQLAPSLDQARYADLERLLGVGQAYEQKTQQGIDQAIQNWNAQQARPWEQLARYSAIVNGQAPFGGTQVTSQQNPLGYGILGGGMAGLGAYGNLARYSPWAANSPWLAGGMGMGGALLGGFL